MRIETDLKLGFKDVMIRPKRSTLSSRSQVTLDRNFTFLHSKHQWNGVPIMAANMDTVGTFEMAKELAKHKIFTAIHKHYTIEEWKEFTDSVDHNISDYIAVSTGTGVGDSKKLATIFEQSPQLKFICIDVANGYSEHFVNFVKNARLQYPDKVIMAGNVVTGEMVEELLLAGADIIKV
ncbi:MAG: IMP dehydrogenase, partial [Bacteroidetes bacterium]|nr:IMP dehydrogenase [Bacteroidota bacterium]